LRTPRNKFKIVAVGGTFDLLHRGHKILLRKALQIGERIMVGLTENGFARTLHKPHRVDPYRRRERELKSFLKKHGGVDRTEIVALRDPFGPSIHDRRIEAIVVSEKTKRTAIMINRIRREKGLKPLRIISIDMVLAEDYVPISTTRIRRGRIDREGYLTDKRSSTGQTLL